MGERGRETESNYTIINRIYTYYVCIFSYAYVHILNILLSVLLVLVLSHIWLVSSVRFLLKGTCCGKQQGLFISSKQKEFDVCKPCSILGLK